MGVFSFDDKVDLQGGEKLIQMQDGPLLILRGLLIKPLLDRRRLETILYSPMLRSLLREMLWKKYRLGSNSCCYGNPSAGVKSDYMFDGEKVEAA